MQFAFNVSKDYFYIEFIPDVDDYIQIKLVKDGDIRYGINDNNLFYLEANNFSKHVDEVMDILSRYLKEVNIQIDKLVTNNVITNDSENSDG